MYSGFEVKFEILPKVYFSQAIYRSKALEVKNLTI